MKKINKIFITNAPLLRGVRAVFFTLTLLYGISAFSQAEPKVSVKVDTTKIRIGEQINFQIEVDNIDTGVTFPELKLDPTGKIEIVEDLNVDTLKNRLVRKYLLTSFDSGSYTIPQQKITVWSQEYMTDSVVIDVSTVAVDTLKQKMFPIKAVQNEPYTFDDFKSYLWWILGGLLLLSLILYFIFRKKKTLEELEAKIPPYNLALKRLKELDEKQLWQKNKIKQYYVELSEIVRLYIERELKIPALESTTNELMDTITDFNSSSALNIPDETIKKLQSLLKDADLVKFAKFIPLSNEIELHRNNAGGVIEDIKTTKPEIVVNKPKCPITNQEATETITLYKWGYYIIFFRLIRNKVAVSAIGKELHLRQQSYFWKIMNKVGNVFMHIPFLGGLLLVIWAVIVWQYLLAVALIELLITGRFLSRGAIYLTERGKVKIKVNDKLKAKINNIKNEGETTRKTVLRKKLTTILIVLSIVIPIAYMTFIFWYVDRALDKNETSSVIKIEEKNKEFAENRLKLKMIEDEAVE